MPVAKLRSSSTEDDGNDFLDNFIKEAIGKEPYLSFSRTGDNPVQWVQLLHALDHQDHPGWPLLTPLKVQMQKCDKCSREFCSSINYRRHIRVHRRSLNPDKDSTVNKDLLGAFWDKLSFDDAKETVTLNTVSLEEVSGSSIVQALTSLIRRPGFSNLPQAYLKAGSALLDVVQARASLFPISSQDFFSILDDASEKTFLRGTAVSLQKYIFDGEAGKIGLEMRNIVACTSFLVEQKLIEAWVAEKNTEALRCQKLLVEEEEAAERRKVDLLERKRQKKLRQKEQKAKEQADVKKADVKQGITVDLMSIVPATEMPSSLVALESDSRSPVSPPGNNPSLCEADQLWTSGQDVDGETKPGLSSEYSDFVSCQDDECRTVQGSSFPELVVAQCQMPKAQCGVPDGIHATTQNAQVSKPGAKQRHGPHREPRAGLIFNGTKVWTRKPKTEKDELGFNKHMLREAVGQPVQSKSCEVMIGSISVALGNCSNQASSLEVQDDCLVENQMLKKNSVQVKSHKTDSGYGAVNRVMVKHWRPIGRHETRSDAPHMKSGNGVSEMDAVTENASDRTLSDDSCLTSCAMDETCSGREANSIPPAEGKSTDLGDLQLSIRAAEAFLAQRWKEAIAAEHAELVLSPESEPPGCCSMARNDTQAAESLLLDSPGRRVLVSTENRLANNGTVFESSTTGFAKANPRTKPEKGVKLKYIPKQDHSLRGGDGL